MGKRRIIRELRHEAWNFRKRIDKLIFDSKGNYKQGVDRRDKFLYDVLRHFLSMWSITSTADLSESRRFTEFLNMHGYGKKEGD